MSIPYRGLAVVLSFEASSDLRSGIIYGDRSVFDKDEAVIKLIDFGLHLLIVSIAYVVMIRACVPCTMDTTLLLTLEPS